MTIIAAFLWGCGVVLVLEGWRRNRPLCALCALVPIAGGMWVGGRPVVTSDVPVMAVVAEREDNARPVAESTAIPSATERVVTPSQTPIVEIVEPAATFAPPHLEIRSLGIDQGIVAVPIEDGRWNVSLLGGEVGWLEGTGIRPLVGETPVLVGHTTFADDQLLAQGAFANLEGIRLGAEVVYWAEGERYVYEVVGVGRVAPDDVARLFAADGKTLLLLTCTDWSEESWSYENRLLVEAVLRE